MSTTDQTISNAAPAPRRRGEPASHSLFSVYKPGQGYWTRTLSAVGGGTLVLAGVAWLWQQMEVIRENTVYWQAAMAAAIVGFFGALLFYLLNKPRIADFMIATEAEMKKVSWPSRREIIGATAVVIFGTIFIALILFVIDIAFGWLFLQIGILEAGSSAAQ